MTVRALVSRIAGRARAGAGGAADGATVDAVELSVRPILTRAGGGNARACGLAVRALISIVARCAGARICRPANDTAVDTVICAI